MKFPQLRLLVISCLLGCVAFTGCGGGGGGSGANPVTAGETTWSVSGAVILPAAYSATATANIRSNVTASLTASVVDTSNTVSGSVAGVTPSDGQFTITGVRTGTNYRLLITTGSGKIILQKFYDSLSASKTGETINDQTTAISILVQNSNGSRTAAQIENGVTAGTISLASVTAVIDEYLRGLDTATHTNILDVVVHSFGLASLAAIIEDAPSTASSTAVQTDIWVDSTAGSDSNNGQSRTSALRTITAAWERVPSRAELTTTGYRILLAPGEYSEASVPGWMSERYGTALAPVTIEAADGQHTARLHAYLNISDVRYFSLKNIDVVTDAGYGSGGNAVHISSSTNVLLKGVTLNGNDGSAFSPQETLKVNQVVNMQIEDCDISGANWFALDFVAVSGGHILRSRIHDSSDDGMVIKGGSNNLRIEGNEIYNCGVIGFTAGQGTGLEYMVSPWLHYEAYDIKFINNVVRNITGAGAGVRGGYNILIAHNTFSRVGLNAAGAGLLLISQGSRSCDGDAAAASQRNLLGGWGPTTVGEGGEWIPNRNVFVYNNIFYNPTSVRTQYSHFVITGPVNPPSGTNIPSPSAADTNLRIRGNIVFNGPSDHPLGVEDAGAGGQDSNPTCNAAQLRADNAINTFEPALVGAPDNLHPVSSGNVYSATTYQIPSFPGGDRAQPPLAPQGDLSNTVASDRDGNARAISSPPGAYAR